MDGDTEYEFRAVADASDGDTDAGSVLTFTTGSGDGDAAPTIDRFDVTDDGNNQWDRYDIDWAVSDDDGDLADVTSEMLDAEGYVLDSEMDDVGGDSASGSHYLKSKDSASEIVLTVTDENGNDTSDSQQV